MVKQVYEAELEASRNRQRAKAAQQRAEEMRQRAEEERLRDEKRWLAETQQQVEDYGRRESGFMRNVNFSGHAAIPTKLRHLPFPY